MSIHIAPQSWPKCVYRVRYAQACESIFRSPGWHQHRHRLWAVDVGLANAKTRIDGIVYRRNKYSVGVYAPHTVYEENLKVGQLNSWGWVLIEEKGKPSSLKNLTGATGFCLLNDPAQAVREKIVQLVNTARNPKPGFPFMLSGLLNQIIGTLFLLHPTESKVRSRSKLNPHPVHPWRRMAWLLLEQLPLREFTGARLANELGISLSALTHQYRKLCGESLQETVNHWRIEKASALLCGDLSIKEIAAKIGCSHQSYFSTLFKTATTYTPSQYRSLIAHQRDLG